MAWGVQGGRRRPQAATPKDGHPKTAMRPIQGWPARRAQKGRAWRAQVKLKGVHRHPLPYVHKQRREAGKGWNALDIEREAGNFEWDLYGRN
jgi:hypothetical protein